MEDQNKYNSHIEIFLKKIGFLQGSLKHIDRDLKGFADNFNEKIKANYEFKDIDFVLGTRLVITDLSGPTDNGALYFHPTDGKYSVTLSNYNQYTNNIIYHYSSFVLLQAYELFTIFFKSNCSLYFASNVRDALRLKVVKRKNKYFLFRIFRFRNNNDLSEYNFEYFFDNIYCGKNNKLLFKYIKRISDHYKKHEINNTRGINLLDFHRVFAVSRHAITHNNMEVTDKLKNSLSNQQLKILKAFTNKDSNKIELTQKRLSYILELICEHAFLIYKSFSIKENLNWKILKYMK